MISSLKSRLKPFLRWLILGGTLFFIASALRQHWQEVAAIRITPSGYGTLAIALLVTLLAHIWSGWVWSWILRELNQPASALWSIQVYLTTNIAKYLPGNVWHFYGRIVAAKNAGFSGGAATLSVLLESLLMAAAALAIGFTITMQIAFATGVHTNAVMQLVCFAAVLIAVHPKFLNPLLQLAGRLKGNSDAPPVQIRRYPLLPLLGEAGFVLLRGLGFLLTLSALTPTSPSAPLGFTPSQIPVIIGAFSFSWVLGLVIPGAPGGIGVFEATALTLLKSYLPTGTIIGGVALYRLISILAELIGAGIASVKRGIKTR